ATARTATGRIAGPLMPPPPAPNRGARVTGSMARPITVLISVTAPAPEPSAAPAISAMSVTFGLSLAHTGVVAGRAPRTAAVPAAVRTGLGSERPPTLVRRSTPGARTSARGRRRTGALQPEGLLIDRQPLLQRAHRERAVGPLIHAGGGRQRGGDRREDRDL